MRQLRVSFGLRSSLRTPFQADTIFGHICWAIRHIAGEERLTSFLSAYADGLPLLVSDGFPVLDTGVRYLPRPLTPLRSGALKAVSESLGIAADDRLARRQFAAAWKALDKKPWVSDEVLFKRLTSLDMAQVFADCFRLRICPISMTEIQPGQCECANWRQCPGLETGPMDSLKCTAAYPESETVLTTHNVLNRWTSTSEDLFQAEDRFSSHGFYFLAQLDESRLSLDEYGACMEYIERSGYGADRSTGKGAICDLRIEEWALPECPGATHYVNLSSAFVPAAGDIDPAESHYAVHVKHGKLGGDYAVIGNVWKKPVMMLTAGSVFPGDPKAPHGQLVRNVHWEYSDVVQYGYAFPMGVRLYGQVD